MGLVVAGARFRGRRVCVEVYPGKELCHIIQDLLFLLCFILQLLFTGSKFH